MDPSWVRFFSEDTIGVKFAAFLVVDWSLDRMQSMGFDLLV